MHPIKQRKYCRKCTSYWTLGIKDGKHNNWCCQQGGPATKLINH